ncbi:methyltransferase [Rhodococcus sp. IEGM 1330]|uniref:methyltransferase n=1 Tax=Rhodococcus sp. IEGM 1330 TaxID=3082225 RepID=UPI002953F730|nr:methyltransferase [Rhodococcus sp. IEGM 1330]MDV8022659.1 methyltransferase [Rhodococcus sp. IEGM 1330]
MTTLEIRDTAIRLIGGYMVSNAIRAASTLDLFGRIDKASDTTIDDLATDLGVPAPNLRRLASLLQSARLIEDIDGRITLTDLGRVLVPGREGSLAEFAQNFTSPLFQRAWDHLETSVRTGDPGFDLEHQQSVYDYLADDEAANTRFNLAMQEESWATANAATALIRLDQDETVVDIGGGDGTFLTTLLRANPSSRGVVYDSPAGISAAQEVIARADVVDRCTATGGDFFTMIPLGGTTYVIKSVLQDWDDEHALHLLRTCRAQIPLGARLIILGNFLPASHDDDAAVGYLTDLCMLVISGGRERTLHDLENLLDKAGFTTDALQIARVGPLTAVELRLTS